MNIGIRTIRVAALVAGALAVASCATVPPAIHQSDLERLANRINSGDVMQLVSGSSPVLLLDSEVYHRSSDIEFLWKGLVADGLKIVPRAAADGGAASLGGAFSNPVPVDAATYRLFGDNFQTKSFFDRYVPKGSYLTSVVTSLGTFRMVVAAHLPEANKAPARPKPPGAPPAGEAGGAPAAAPKAGASSNAAKPSPPPPESPVVIAVSGPLSGQDAAGAPSTGGSSGGAK